MSAPVQVDLPHKLGAAEAKRRIAANVGKLAGALPGGAAVHAAWQGDRCTLDAAALGQRLDATLDVEEARVRVTIHLPPALAFFGKAIEAGVRRQGGALLEDHTGG